MAKPVSNSERPLRGRINYKGLKKRADGSAEDDDGTKNEGGTPKSVSNPSSTTATPPPRDTTPDADSKPKEMKEWICDHPGCGKKFKKESAMKTHKSMSYSHKVASAPGSNKKSAKGRMVPVEPGSETAGSRMSSVAPSRVKGMLKRGRNKDDVREEDSASPAPAKKRRIKEEIDEDTPLSAVPVPKKAGPGRRKKFVEKEKEEVIDWDALRAPTPPGLCPTPPWRREKRPPIPLVSEGYNNSEQLIPTGANPILLAASQSRQQMGLDPTSNNLKSKSSDAKGEGEGSYPTPPLQPYDLMGAHRQGQGQGPSARWGSKMVNWDQSTPEGERVEQLHSYYARQSMQAEMHMRPDRNGSAQAETQASGRQTSSEVMSPNQRKMKINHLLND